MVVRRMTYTPKVHMLWSVEWAPPTTSCGRLVNETIQTTGNLYEVTCSTCRPSLRKINYRHTLDGWVEYIKTFPHVGPPVENNPATWADGSPNEHQITESVVVFQEDIDYPVRYHRTRVWVWFKHDMPHRCDSPVDAGFGNGGQMLHLWSLNKGKTFRLGDGDMHKLQYGHAIPRFTNGTRMTIWAGKQHSKS
jgi:hypothetical protein